MIHQFTLSFTPVAAAAPLQRHSIYMSSLHGWLFQTVLPAFSQTEADWLHTHPAPKPFSLAPIISDEGEINGLRVTVWDERAAAALSGAWQQAITSNKTFQLGGYPFVIGQVKTARPVEFVTLLDKARSFSRMRLQFMTPTAFHQGPVRLHLPLPGNVFERPYLIWNSYAPPTIKAPATWPAWCVADVMASHHRIQTEQLQLNQKARFTGFIGFVEFETRSRDETALRIWQALGRLASYCGVGYKTTMGMGSVTYLI